MALNAIPRYIVSINFSVLYWKSLLYVANWCHNVFRPIETTLNILMSLYWLASNLTFPSLFSYFCNYSKVTRKHIATILTVLNQTQREHLRAHYKGKKYAPLDLRVKKTRAIRRRLTKHEATLQTERSAKKARHFALRKYAVKA